VLVMHGSFLPRTDPSLLFAFHWLFMLSQIAFGFMVASFFSRAKLAAIVGPFLQFAAVMPRCVPGIF
jgi:ABC-type transport system involved in multi-copper enzyme maturation permease subunit